MTVYELVDALGGEIVRGRARVRRGDEYILLGELVEGEMTLTEAGAKLVARTAPVAEEPKPPAKVARQTRTRRFTPLTAGDQDILDA